MILSLLASSLAIDLACAGETVRTDSLTVDHLVAPANRDGSPRFGWKMSGSRIGARQTAFRIRVSDAMGRELWDSGEVAGSGSVGVPYAGRPLEGAHKYNWSVTVRDELGNWLPAAASSFETGVFAANAWKGSVWISSSGGRDATEDEKTRYLAAPGTSCFVKRVTNGRKVQEAFWSVSGLGVFEAYVNGRPVSRKVGGRLCRDRLKPGYTSATKTKYAYTYDVTHLMKTEAGASNVLAAQVSAGWWRDRVANYQGRRSAFRAVLILRYEDGTETLVPTDLSWKAKVGGPVVKAAIYDGESYDARESRAWMVRGDADGFAPVVANTEFAGEVLPAKGGVVTHREDLAFAPKSAYVWRKAEGARTVGGKVESYGKVRKLRSYRDGETMTLKAGETLVVDFGQNAAAVPEFVATAASGVRLTMLPAEILNDGNGAVARGCDGPEGSVYRTNLRRLARDGARIDYVFAGKGPETYRPEFSYFGYRFLSLTATGEVSIQRLRSVPVTSVLEGTETGALETGDKDVNQLASNALWSMYSNYLSVPTDCPQRDERQGWAADAQIFSAAACYCAEVYGFFDKWMRDLRDCTPCGIYFPSAAPVSFMGHETWRFGWSDAGVVVPYNVWRQFGDRDIVDRNWSAMSSWVGELSKAPYNSAEAMDYQWGDWVSCEKLESWSGRAFEKGPDGRERPRPEARQYWKFLGGCHWLLDAEMMARMARGTGRQEDAERFARMTEQARTYLRENFVDKEDGLLLPLFRDMQTPALFALKCRLFASDEAKAKTVAALLENVRAHGNCLQTGMLGTAIILDVLATEADNPQAAYSLLLQHRNPSWLYSVDQGATTIWERWDGYRKDVGIGFMGMNSFNHYALGSVLAWMYGTMAGIRQDVEIPGFRRFVLEPKPDSRLGHVTAAFESPYGRIESDWRYAADGTWTWRFTVPANTTASVVVPGEDAKDYVAGSYEIVRKPVRKVANIVNFVRSLDPRIPHAELERALDEELKLNEKYGFPNTVLLQYDALVNAEILSVLRRHAIPQPELGLWFEMSRPLCEAAGVPWRGREGWDWDWHIRPGFLMSYAQDERRALIDAAFEKFRATFGRVPRVVGSWLLDSYSVAYMAEKYAIDGVCICREQDATDAYGLRGGYSNGAYYPARRNILSAASDRANAIPVPVFKMLTPDPIYNYGRMAFDPAVGGRPPTIEPVWLSGLTPKTVDWYFRTYTGSGLLNLSYMQIGQENSFGWEMISKGLPMQCEKLNALWKAGKIEVETFGETARRFRHDHAQNCPQTQIALEDWSGRGYRSVWYNCKNYRANLFLDGGRLMLRDMHVMRDDFEEPYRDEPCEGWKAEYYTPPVFDDWLYEQGESAGKALLDGVYGTMSAEPTSNGDGLVVTAVRKDGTKVLIEFSEKGIAICGSALRVPVPGKFRPSVALNDSEICMQFRGCHYRVSVGGEIKETDVGYVIGPEFGRVELRTVEKD